MNMPIRQLEVDWSALHSAYQLNVPEIRCFLSLRDGKVVKVQPGDPRIVEIRTHAADFIEIDTVPSRVQYQWVDEFIHSIEDEALRARFQAAVNGKGAFRRFKDLLLTLPDERRRWFEFRDLMIRQRIVDWLREVGVEPTTEPPWSSSATPEAPAPSTDPRHVEALRDFLIAWSEGRGVEALAPLELERLAHQIGERFRLKPRGD